MRKTAALAAIALSCAVLGAAEVDVEPAPNAVELSWAEVEGAVHYDIYIDDVFRARLAADETSARVESLPGDEEVKVSWAARDGGDNNLDVHIEMVTTGSWDGEYVWTNSTGDDNKGKVREIRMSVEMKDDPRVGQYPEIRISTPDGWVRFFPFFDFDSIPADFTKYKEDTPGHAAFRAFSDMFNTLGISPSRWKIDRMEVSPTRVRMECTMKAVGLSVKTWATLELKEDESGAKTLVYTMGGDPIYEMAAFMNPVDGSSTYVLAFEG